MKPKKRPLSKNGPSDLPVTKGTAVQSNHRRHLAGTDNPIPTSHTYDSPRSRQAALIVAALVGATLASSVLVTADAASVFEGASLPQVLLILVTGVIASLSTLGTRARGRSDRTWLTTALLTAFAGCLLVSSITATIHADGRAAWNGAWHIIGLLVFAIVVRELVRSPQVARVCFRLLILSTVFLSAHAVHQLAISLPQTRIEYERDPDGGFAELQIDAPKGSAMRAQYENRLYSSEPLATFALTNSLAVVLSGALVALTVVALQGRCRRQSILLWIVMALAWMLIAAVWMLTKSRTAYVGVGCVALFTAGMIWRLQRHNVRRVIDQRAIDLPRPVAARRWMSAAMIGIGLAAAVALIALLAQDRLILSEAPKSLAYRLEYWQASSQMILEHPLTGVGLGNFQSYYPRYKLPTASEVVADPHNWMLDLAATCSLPALMLAIVAVLSVLSRSWSGLRLGPVDSASGTNSHEHDAAAKNHAFENDDARTNRHAHSDGVTEMAWHNRLARWLWWGAIAGWSLTAALQWMVHEAIDLEASILAGIIGLVLVLPLRLGDGNDDRSIRLAALTASMTMLVCLLASGSWQASGLALPLAAWLGLCLPGGSSNDPNRSHHGSKTNSTVLASLGPRSLLPVSLPRLLPVSLFALLLIFFWQTWRPVQSSWVAQQSTFLALSRGELDTALLAASASVEADPIDPAVHRLLVQVLASRADHSPQAKFSSACAQTRQAIERLLRCDPSASANWSFAAETLINLSASAQRRIEDHSAAAQLDGARADARSSNAAALANDATASVGSLANRLPPGAVTADAPPTSEAPTSKPLAIEAIELLRVADDDLAEAIVRYPSSVALHAQRALVLAWLQQPAAAQQSAQEAFELSNATSHTDRQLAMQQVWLPQALEQFPPAVIQRSSQASSWAQAEPLCDFLRTLSKASSKGEDSTSPTR